MVLLGGIIVVIFFAFDSGTRFAGRLRIATLLSLALPAIYFYINYLARYIGWMRGVLIVSFIAGMMINSYLLSYPVIRHDGLPYSNIALIIFLLLGYYLWCLSEQSIE